jgi:predicted ATPase/DNA-binding SARP family transcriptional activator
MRIGLLGELEVRDGDGGEVAITGAKLRALLAVLALQPGRAVSTDTLVEALWGDDPPPAVRNGLQGLVSKLRRALGAADAVTMRGGGYALEVAPDDVDVHRFERLVAESRAATDAGGLEDGIRLLDEAEALWRGAALADFTYEPFAAPVITRLAEQRLAAREERLHGQLLLGRHHQVVVELEALVEAEPLRERPRGLLMLALYRSGRQADALRVFQDGRRILGEELGLDPGPELRQLEAAILAQDPSLDLAPEPAGTRPAARPPKGRATLPAPLTPLVGREDAVRDLRRLLDEHRLLTLVGPGGVGKTRLGLEVARQAAEDLVDGGCLVELAPVTDRGGVRAAVAAALDLPDPELLAESIGDRELLVLLDNCEHVIEVAAALAEDLLRHCPGLRLLATSREGLRVGGEAIWPVPPLAPGDAVELFLARARAAGATIDDGAADVRAAVTDICTRLDGLPLAIELAAARTRAFPVAQISSRLHDRFRLLTGGSRTALPRQQTLRAVVDWSYELLFADEQRVFERLSVLPGGCTLASAEAVCADQDLSPADVADLVQALVDKSLVLVDASGDELRFTQLQTRAQYAREKLAGRGEALAVRRAMVHHFADLCAESASAYRGPRQRAWLRSIDQEHDNLSAALEWAVDDGDAEAALTIAGGTSWTQWLGGRRQEGRRWLEAAFACPGADDVDPRTRALALVGRGIIGLQFGEVEAADEDLQAGLAIFHEIGDFDGVVLGNSFACELPVLRGDPDEARRRRRASLELLRQQPDEPFIVASRAYAEGKLALLDRDLATAEQRYAEATATFVDLDRPVMASLCLDVVADFAERNGDHRAAIAALERALATNESLGLRGFGGSLLARLGWMRLHAGDRDGAEAAYTEALDLARWLDNHPVTFVALTGLAMLRLTDGQVAAAEAAATEALELFAAGQHRRMRNRIDQEAERLVAAAACSVVLARAALDAGAPERAADALERARGLMADVPLRFPALLDDVVAGVTAELAAGA